MEPTIAPLVHTALRGDEVLGYVAIDSTIAGRSCGGLRMMPDVDAAEMRGLARAMTLKYGFLGLPQGGAKAGVLGDPEAPLPERRQRLAEFAQAIAPLLRRREYIPNADMGTDNADIRYLLETVGVPVNRRELRVADSGSYTARTVFSAVKQAARYRGLDLATCRVAVEGYGKVGRPLARLLAQAGARIVAISTSQGARYTPRGLDLDRLDGEQLPCESLLELPVDILCPCARHATIHAGNVGAVKAEIICPGANNPVTPEARRVLFERGTLFVPDFVSNCGGVLGGTMEFASVNPSVIVATLDERMGARIAALLAEAARRNIPAYDLAEEIARQRFERVRASAEHPSWLFQKGLEAYRRGWLPGWLVGRLAVPFFQRAASP